MENSDRKLMDRLDKCCEAWSLGGAAPQIVFDARERLKELLEEMDELKHQYEDCNKMVGDLKEKLKRFAGCDDGL